ncbi:hypothetical protein GN956_G21060 [Arapaima gigas]
MAVHHRPHSEGPAKRYLKWRAGGSQFMRLIRLQCSEVVETGLLILSVMQPAGSRTSVLHQPCTERPCQLESCAVPFPAPYPLHIHCF